MESPTDDSTTAGGAGPLAGRRIGPYRIETRIDHGGQGEIYRGRHETLDKPVAIKAVRGEIARDAQALRRLFDESLKASRINHPYVATIHDVVECDGTPLVVMEFIEGRSFDQVLRGQRLEPGRLRRYAIEISEALAAIHRAGLVHRDLKPGNVMLTAEDHVKVLDFGLATANPLHEDDTKPGSQHPTVSQHRPGALVGTPAYMSPEQAAGAAIDQRSDLFSFGVILWQAITGVHPFRHPSQRDTLAAILRDPPSGSPPQSADPDLARIARRLLEKEPARRYQAAEELLEDLRSTARPSRWRRWAVAAAVVAMGVAGGWWAMQPKTRPAFAVLPFTTAAGADESGAHGSMMADLIAAHIGESRRARALLLDRVRSVLVALPNTATPLNRRERVAEATAADWIVDGTIYREAPDYVAKVDVHPARRPGSAFTFSVRGGSIAGLARLATVRIQERVFGIEPDAYFPTSSDDKALELYEVARRRIREQRFADALGLLEQTTERDPGFVWAWLELAELRNRVGYQRLAREVIEQAKSPISSGNIPADSRIGLVLQGVEARILARRDEAIRIFSALAERFPDEPETLRRLAEAFTESRRDAEALEVADRMLGLDPLDPRTHLLRTKLLARLERNGEARRALDEAGRLLELFGGAPGLAERERERAYLLYREGHFRKSADAYGSAAQRFEAESLPGSAAGALDGRAVMELKLWQLEQAAKTHRAALPMARRSGNFRAISHALAGLGGILYRQRKLDDAEAALQESLDEALKLQNEALELSPRSTLARVLLLKGQTQEARRHARQALAIAERSNRPGSVFAAHLILAEADRGDGRFDEAIDSLRGLAAEGSAYWRSEALLALADLLGTRGNLTEALDAVSAAVDLRRPTGRPVETGYALAVRGRVRSAAGLLTEATQDLEEARWLLEPALAAPTLLDSLTLGEASRNAANADWEALLRQPAPADGFPTAESFSLALYRAEALAHTGKPAEALAIARAVRDHPRSAPENRAWALLLIARALDGGPAVATARQARELADRLGMPLLSLRAAALLRGADIEGDAAPDLRSLLEQVPAAQREWWLERWDVREARGAPEAANPSRAHGATIIVPRGA